jgi:predicted DsbA family dithiol-disulfide isomerase
VIFRHRAFELDPAPLLRHDLSLDELVAHKYSISLERAHAPHDRLVGRARALNVKWSLASARPTNTFDAPTLTTLDSAKGLGGEVSERLFQAYVCEGVLVSDLPKATDFAREVELAGVVESWAGDAYVDRVRVDEASALELGLTGVATFLVDSRLAVVDTSDAGQILGTLLCAWARRSA